MRSDECVKLLVVSHVLSSYVNVCAGYMCFVKLQLLLLLFDFRTKETSVSGCSSVCFYSGTPKFGHFWDQ